MNNGYFSECRTGGFCSKPYNIPRRWSGGGLKDIMGSMVMKILNTTFSLLKIPQMDLEYNKKQLAMREAKQAQGALDELKELKNVKD